MNGQGEEKILQNVQNTTRKKEKDGKKETKKTKIGKQLQGQTDIEKLYNGKSFLT
jgi:hypothetical protein